ncbi:hypothetical protein QAD02_003269 [Eretmocerus hayati]|uniref:Uncharacterized protein n=1 Tax=Eretmocerus hayati TaxID=131215 RepID=A0ACC2NL77_9HYME|nr:hypothetical protein QAD02_003269 [Eretmocerus hayati]
MQEETSKSRYDAELRKLPTNAVLAKLVEPHKCVYDKQLRASPTLGIQTQKAWETIADEFYQVKGLNLTVATFKSMWKRMSASCRKDMRDGQSCSTSMAQQRSGKNAAVSLSQPCTSTSATDNADDDYMAYYKKLPLHRLALATEILVTTSKKQKAKKSQSKKRKLIKMSVPEMDKFAQKEAATADKIVQRFVQFQKIYHETKKPLDETSKSKRTETEELIMDEFKNVKKEKREECYNEILDIIGVINVCPLLELGALSKSLHVEMLGSNGGS